MGSKYLIAITKNLNLLTFSTAYNSLLYVLMYLRDNAFILRSRLKLAGSSASLCVIIIFQDVNAINIGEKKN